MQKLIIRREDVDSINLNEESTLLELINGNYVESKCHAIDINLVLVPLKMSDHIGDLVCLLREYYVSGETLDMDYYPQDGVFKYARCQNLKVAESEVSSDATRTSFSFRLKTPNYGNNKVKWKKVK